MEVVEVLEVVEVDRDGKLRRAWEWSGMAGGSAYVGPHGSLRKAARLA